MHRILKNAPQNRLPSCRKEAKVASSTVAAVEMAKLTARTTHATDIVQNLRKVCFLCEPHGAFWNDREQFSATYFPRERKLRQSQASFSDRKTAAGVREVNKKPST